MPQLVRIAHHVYRPSDVTRNLQRRSLHHSLGCLYDDTGQAINGRKAQREVLAPPRIRAFALGVKQELRHAIGTLDHVQRRPHLAAAVCHDARVAREELRHRIEITRLGCRHECGHELRMFRVDLARTLRRSRAAWSRGAYVRACAGGKLPHAASLRSSPAATSLNEKSNTSCSRKAARSSGESRSSVKSSAMDRSSASSVRLSGASVAVSRTGSGSHGPTYSSRRARADFSMSRQIRVVVVMRNALGSTTLSRSAPCQRKYASCTASSASAIDPSIRYARPSRRRRYGSKLEAGFDIALMPGFVSSIDHLVHL